MIGIAASAGIGLDAPRRLVAVDHRQLDVHQDQVGLVLGRLATPSAPSAPRSARSPLLEQVAQDLAVVLGVLDDQDALAHWAASIDRRRRWTGMDDPEGRALAELRLDRDACRHAVSTICLRDRQAEAGAALLARVRVVDLLELVEDLAPGRRARCRGRYRAPQTRSGRPSGAARISTSPSSVNLIALPTRLSSTCVRRRASPCRVGRPGAHGRR